MDGHRFLYTWLQPGVVDTNIWGSHHRQEQKGRESNLGRSFPMQTSVCGQCQGQKQAAEMPGPRGLTKSSRGEERDQPWPVLVQTTAMWQGCQALGAFPQEGAMGQRCLQLGVHLGQQQSIDATFWVAQGAQHRQEPLDKDSEA